MNQNLKQVKENLKKIDNFCLKGAIPTEQDIDIFLRSESLVGLEYREYALHLNSANKTKQFLLWQNKANKQRV